MTISGLRPGSPAVRVCAQWRYDAFLKDDGFTFEETPAQLAVLVERQDYEIALLAEVEDVPAGTCLFVREEIDPRHELTPWLAGLFVAPTFRGQSVGRALVAAIEDHAPAGRLRPAAPLCNHCRRFLCPARLARCGAFSLGRRALRAHAARPLSSMPASPSRVSLARPQAAGVIQDQPAQSAGREQSSPGQ